MESEEGVAALFSHDAHGSRHVLSIGAHGLLAQHGSHRRSLCSLARSHCEVVVVEGALALHGVGEEVVLTLNQAHSRREEPVVSRTLCSRLAAVVGDSADAFAHAPRHSVGVSVSGSPFVHSVSRAEVVAEHGCAGLHHLVLRLVDAERREDYGAVGYICGCSVVECKAVDAALRRLECSFVHVIAMLFELENLHGREVLLLQAFALAHSERHVVVVRRIAVELHVCSYLILAALSELYGRRHVSVVGIRL